MRAPLSASSLVVLAVTGLAACPGPVPSTISQADVAAIQEASDGYAAAASEAAWGRWVEYFADDATVLPPNAAAVDGRAAIEAWARSFPAFRDFLLEKAEIVGVGDLAYVLGRYSMVLLPTDSSEVRDEGKYIEIWRKQADGTWKLSRDIFNSDLPAPGTSP